MNKRNPYSPKTYRALDSINSPIFEYTERDLWQTYEDGYKVFSEDDNRYYDHLVEISAAWMRGYKDNPKHDISSCSKDAFRQFTDQELKEEIQRRELSKG